MQIKTIPVGHLETNCYVVTDEKSLVCAVIDPGDEFNSIMDYIESNKLRCEAILITHGHYDHVGAVPYMVEETGAVVYSSEKDLASREKGYLFPLALPENGKTVREGDVITVSGLKFEVYETPGHSPGGLSFRCEDALFTGDTLFKGSCGRTDLYGGDVDTLMSSLAKLCSIAEDLEVYPGHMDSSSLMQERLLNYYCRAAVRNN